MANTAVELALALEGNRGLAAAFLPVGLEPGHTEQAAVAAAALSIFTRPLCFWGFAHGFGKPDPHVFCHLTTRLGLRGIRPEETLIVGDSETRRSCPCARFVGFFRAASSLLEEIQRHDPELVADIAVVDFSPVARDGLLKRRVPIIYGDVSHRETLVHAGVDKAEVLISTVPDSLLKGTTNARLVRLLRDLNPKAKIIVTADVLAQAAELLDAGADYVNVPRLRQAGDLLEAVRAAREELLDEKRAALREILVNRREVLA